MMGQDYQIYLAGAAFDPKMVLPACDREYSHYIVQFYQQLTCEEQQHLRTAYSLSLTEYVPNFAYLERISSQKLSELSRDKLHRAHVPYEAKYKISPSIGESGADNSGRIPLRLVLFPEANVDDVISAINLLRGVRFSSTAGDAGRIDKLDDTALGGQLKLIFSFPSEKLLTQLESIASLEGVRWIEEAKPLSTGEAKPLSTGEAKPLNIDVRANPRERIPAGVIQSGKPADTPVWRQGITGLGQVIGVTDGPPDLEHCQLRDTNGNPVGSSHRKIEGTRHGSGLNDHGMRVVSIAAGRNVNISDPEQDLYKGVAYEARLSLDSIADLNGRQTTVMQVLDNQRCDGAFTHSNSWHDEAAAYNQVAADFDNFVWLNEQNLVCGSSGNDEEPPGPPATAKNALSVSASMNAPDEMKFGDGVSKPLPDGRRKPDICAPGCDIYPANITTRGERCSAALKSKCESSWAAPAIAAAAALVRQYYVEGWYPTGSKVKAHARRDFVSAALVKATLLNSTVDMTGVADYPSAIEGWGLVRLSNSLFFAGGTRKLFIDDVSNSRGLHTHDSRTYEISIQDSGQPLKITICWSDPPPGVFSMGHALVNDLDLIVNAPDGRIFFGNNIDTATGFSNPGIAYPDNRNNVEMVIIDRPPPGAWKITVRSAATNVGQTGQGFALVVSASLS